MGRLSAAIAATSLRTQLGSATCVGYSSRFGSSHRCGLLRVAGLGDGVITLSRFRSCAAKVARHNLFCESYYFVCHFAFQITRHRTSMLCLGGLPDGLLGSKKAECMASVARGVPRFFPVMAYSPLESQVLISRASS